MKITIPKPGAATAKRRLGRGRLHVVVRKPTALYILTLCGQRLQTGHHYVDDRPSNVDAFANAQRVGPQGTALCYNCVRMFTPDTIEK